MDTLDIKTLERAVSVLRMLGEASIYTTDVNASVEDNDAYNRKRNKELTYIYNKIVNKPVRDPNLNDDTFLDAVILQEDFDCFRQTYEELADNLVEHQDIFKNVCANRRDIERFIKESFDSESVNAFFAQWPVVEQQTPEAREETPIF